ncbi:DUF6221 family protein [Streptomyces bottropensis]|uniref:DUF6221 family protein n=1 Tax=Streptomyces bottropensis TaxID=42235 RepID=UPI00382D6031
MPDLHGWITQQVDETQRIAEAARGQGNGQWRHDSSYENGYVYDEHDQPVVYDEGTPLPEEAAHIAFHDPATVLRRCAADRKILARHCLDPDAIWYEAAMCEGCGTEGEMAYPRTENLNDCPELLDLAEAHGLTPEILASLDRPQEGERPEPSGPSLLPAGLAESMYGNLYAFALGTRTVESPKAKAMKILEPELKKIPGYVPTTKEQP